MGKQEISAIWQGCLSSPSFWMPDYFAPSAWLEHAPFAFWLVDALRPNRIVELGTHHGFSYLAFCEAVKRLSTETVCCAVDTWEGDEHSGKYSEDVIAELQAVHDPKYGAFSTLMRMTFEEAVHQFADGSIDLLHIDGRHRYEDVFQTFDTWKSKLSERAVVVFHDIYEFQEGFGVYKFWEQISETNPAFGFTHGHGLGILGYGAEQSDPLKRLFTCQKDAIQRNKIREAYAALGLSVRRKWDAQDLMLAVSQSEAIILERDKEVLSRDKLVNARDIEIVKQRHIIAELEVSRSKLLDDMQALSNSFKETEVRRDESERLRQENATKANVEELNRLYDELAAAKNEVVDTRKQLIRSESARVEIYRSRSWRLTAPIRSSIVQKIYRKLKRPVVALWRRLQSGVFLSQTQSEQFGSSSLSKSIATKGLLSNGQLIKLKKWLIVSGEPHTPGHHYRVEYHVSAGLLAGLEVNSATVENALALITSDTSVVLIWRAQWSEQLAAIYNAARKNSAVIIFDVDDLMFDAALANYTTIDGIRTAGVSEDVVAQHYDRVLRSLLQADFASAPTAFLAYQMRRFQKPAFVLPNGFTDQTLNRSRLAVRGRRLSKDEHIRIGYAGGTRTHQKDFAVVSKAVARVLRERPSARLVLFSHHGSSIVDISEFPELDQLDDQIEWRKFVSLEDLPTELARFDINLAPLQLGNPFCDAKSELKYFEAALVDVPTIASPTDSFARAISHGVSGILASTEDDWRQAIISLIDDPDTRRQIARSAFHDSLWRYGPEERASRLISVTAEICGDARSAADAFVADLRRPSGFQGGIQIPRYEIVFERDLLGPAEATVVIPLHNYENFVGEALDSVAAQTIADLHLVVVDDGSTDGSLDAALSWLQANHQRFGRVALARCVQNSGLALTRNIGFSIAETQFILPLDADNILLPCCVESCLDEIRCSAAAYVFPQIQRFGDDEVVIGQVPYAPRRFMSGNFVDAMALVRKATWAQVRGYDHIKFGYEDYDFWAKCAEAGLWGVAKPEILARYRVHGKSMSQTQTNSEKNKDVMFGNLEQKHPWTKFHRGPTAFD